jgi:hypothetical protein
VRLLTEAFAGFSAPPRHDRPVGVQEVETCLCKYKSYVNGHYPIGKDSRELRHALTGWGSKADQLRAFVPGVLDVRPEGLQGRLAQGPG